MTSMRILGVLLLFGLLACLAGCGGGGGSDLTAGVELTIGADTSPDGVRLPTRAVGLSAPLDSGAQVTVYDFGTGKKIADGTTDNEGFCPLEVPPGLTVAVVITGARDGKNYRLSTIIPFVPTVDETYIVNPNTSVAAEALAQKHYRQNEAIDEDTWNALMEEANSFVQDNIEGDFSLSGSILVGGADDFGKTTGLGAAAGDVVGAVPDEIDQAVVAAKNAIRQIEQAGMPLEGMLSQERPDIEGIFTNAVKVKYSALEDRLSLMILPALNGNMWLDDGDWNEVDLEDLEPGKKYEVTWAGWGSLDIVESADAGQEGKVIIVYDDESGEVYDSPVTWTLTAAQPSSTEWTLVQTCTGDASQEYKAVVKGTLEDLGGDPSANVKVTLKDSEFPQALTFDGTISATGPDRDSYTRIVCNGTLVSPEVTASGRFEANFPSEKPDGAWEEESIYDFPTKMAMTNANIAVSGGETTIRITGSISAETAVLHESEWDWDGAWYERDVPFVEPKSIDFKGTYANSKSGLNFNGEITGSWTNAGDGITAQTAKGSVTLDGSLTREGYNPYTCKMVFTMNEGSATCSLNELRLGAATLSGEASATYDEDLEEWVGTLSLQNHLGVVVTIERNDDLSVTGDIKKGSDKAADISEDGEMLSVAFTDGTFREFYF